jgi:hypothetical protein
MFFNSLQFAYFLPIVFILYWFISKNNLKFQNLILLISSNFLFDGNVLDFTAKNNLTDTCINYYEWSHFRPFIGDSILAKIYH